MLEEKLNIKNMIYIVRGKQVMLDSDLAKLYQVETKRINEAVRRNLEKFPDRYCFKISEELYTNLKSQIATSNLVEHGGSRKGHSVFTEQGVAMLSTILKSKVAIQVSINIMDAFVEMRKYISTNLLEQKYINELVLKDSRRIDVLEETFNSFKEKNNHIFFEGQIYDAYSLLKDIFNQSKKEIIIIDNYVDKSLFDILSKTKKEIIVITNKYNNEDYNKYKKEYTNVKLIINNSIHDRFIIIDRVTLYHCGASFKDLGNKCFCISRILEEDSLKIMLSKLFDNDI